MDDPIVPINGSERDSAAHRYILCFGAYGWTRLMVWANHLEDALDECVDWIADNAPGLLADDAVAEAYREAIAGGMSEDDAREEAETDMTIAGDSSHYLASWEWGIVAEDPSREQILELQGRKPWERA